MLLIIDNGKQIVKRADKKLLNNNDNNDLINDC